MRITDFEVDKIIGIGHFGKVHKAWNKRQNRWVALKALQKDQVAEMSHVEHVINEREILFYLQDINTPIIKIRNTSPYRRSESQISEESSDADEPTLQCPFLMQAYSTFQDKEHLYFELEYVEGCTLLS